MGKKSNSTASIQQAVSNNLNIYDNNNNFSTLDAIRSGFKGVHQNPRYGNSVLKKEKLKMLKNIASEKILESSASKLTKDNTNSTLNLLNKGAFNSKRSELIQREVSEKTNNSTLPSIRGAAALKGNKSLIFRQDTDPLLKDIEMLDNLDPHTCKYFREEIFLFCKFLFSNSSSLFYLAKKLFGNVSISDMVK